MFDSILSNMITRDTGARVKWVAHRMRMYLIRGLSPIPLPSFPFLSLQNTSQLELVILIGLPLLIATKQ